MTMHKGQLMWIWFYPDISWEPTTLYQNLEIYKTLKSLNPPHQGEELGDTAYLWSYKSGKRNM